ncbi:hypothetical protein DB88DRAFT_480303 [Papiliotrema laurentii]|uniref:Major facilitator superfamily (MFS) profile domain-containing protein n=1 Tax=Papiliotrema laurentii TaxID=5418 RepID=A0AAD9L787_PAPLA|nr:hypothetical protein DB88DRAFT_480303 [Papiliotrema laurentii]
MSRPSPADPALNIIAQCDAPESGAKDGDVESKSLQLQDESDGKDEKQETDLTTDGGVARIGALYLVFGRGGGLYALWVSIALIAYVYSLSRSTTGTYAQFVTSAYKEHTVIGTIGVINGIVGGVLPPFVAKLADIWSRPHTLALSVLLYAVGFAMVAGCNNVSTAVGGMFISTLGNTGITFMNSLLIADITSLQWRATINGAFNLPYVLNTFVAGYISAGISANTQNGWRWGYGMFCILVPVCISPAVIVLLIGDRRAQKLGVVSLATSSLRQRQVLGEEAVGPTRTRWETIRYYWTRLNVLGLLLMGFAFGLLLAPVTLSSTAKNGWKNPSLIAMETIGGVLFIAWAVWDGFFADYPFMPKRVFNRSFCACVMVDVFYYSSSYLVDTYFSSWVYVVVDWNYRDYTFFASSMSATMCFFAIFFGLAIRYVHGYKYVQLFGLALKSIGFGLVYRSTFSPSTGTLVASQILYGLGGAASVIASYIGVQGSVAHQDMAIATAVLNLWSSIGSSITVAISAAVWNRQVPAKLMQYVGDVYSATEIMGIFGDITVARLAEPRDLIKQAYLESMRGLFLAGLVVSFGSIIAGAFTVNFYLGQQHNIVEPEKIIRFRTAEEIEGEVRKRAQ